MGAVGLQIEIDKIARNMERSYNQALKKMKKLKSTLNTLEQTLSQDYSSKTDSRVKKLTFVAERLNKFSDSMLIQSKKAWHTQSTLEFRCKSRGLELTRLDKVRILCMKTESLATDLLCYSMGHLRPK